MRMPLGTSADLSPGTVFLLTVRPASYGAELAELQVVGIGVALEHSDASQSHRLERHAPPAHLAHALHARAVDARRPQVHEDEVVVRAAGHEREACARQRVREALRVRDHLRAGGGYIGGGGPWKAAAPRALGDTRVDTLKPVPRA